MNVFDTFCIYSGLKPNKSKCETDGIVVHLTKNSVKTLSIHFSYN